MTKASDEVPIPLKIMIVAFPINILTKTAPTIIFRPGHDLRAQRVGFDVTQYREQVLVILDHRALEPPLPHVAAGAVVPVITLSVRDQQTLQDPADRRPGWPDQQMEVVVEQAIAVQLEWLTFLEVGHGREKCSEVSLLEEDRLPIVATIDHVVD